MKRILAFLSLGLLFAAPAIQAQYPPPVPQGMGTKLAIWGPVDPGNVDRSYLNAPDVRHIFKPFWGYEPSSLIHRVIWHPDGKHIYFADLDFIYMVPVTGGIPRLILDSYFLYPYQGKRYVVSQTVQELAGFSPDGKYLYITRDHFDQESGGEITVTPKPDPYYELSASAGSIALERLDLQTGEIKKMNSGLAHAIVYVHLSTSGKYLTYTNRSTEGVITQHVMDTASFNDWEIPVTNVWGFSGDTYLLYSQNKQLLRIPVKGGNSELVAALSSTGTNQPGINPDTPTVPLQLSPDSKWALTEINTGNRYNDTIIKPDGNKFSFNGLVGKLCYINLNTGAITDALPIAGFLGPRDPHFSPDGKQYCYILENDENINYCQEFDIYIKDFTPFQDIPEKPSDVADATPVNFAIFGNYPNPFNPSTTISFSLPETGSASLAIYNASGQKIRELASGTLSAGKHSVVWDGRDQNGNTISSGVYISRLTMRDKVTANRMLLVK